MSVIDLDRAPDHPLAEAAGAYLREETKMKIGDKMLKTPVMWGELENKHRTALPCTVVAINQRHGHYTVRFDTPGGPVLETYRVIEGVDTDYHRTYNRTSERDRKRRQRQRKRAAR